MTARETELTAQLSDCQAQLASARQVVDRLEKENALLRQKIDLLIRRVFGAKSEKMNPAQLELLLQAELGAPPGAAEKKPAATAGLADEPAEAPRPKAAAKNPRRPRLPDHLPVEQVVIDPPQVTDNPDAWRCMGEERSEQLDYEPGRYLKRVTVRRKWVRLDQPFAPPVIAELPARLAERSLPAPGLLAHIIVSKYCDHLPLYRQEQIARTRFGVDLPRQTMARWLQMAAVWLAVLYEIIKKEVLSGGCAQCDETPARYLEPGHGKTQQGYLWVIHRPGAGSFFTWHTSRAASCLESIIPPDTPPLILGVDGYQAYRSFARQRPGQITLAGCLAHARREFFEGKDQDPQVAGFILRQIGHLYAIEAALRQARATPVLRQAARACASRPIMQRLHRLMIRLQEKRRHLPQSQLGKAVSYFLNQWDELRVFLKDGRVEIDNNLVENAIRPTAIGKKNWLFIGEGEAGQACAVLYTLVENCRQNGLDPWRYLRDVITLLPDARPAELRALLPGAWADRQKAATAPAAKAA